MGGKIGGKKRPGIMWKAGGKVQYRKKSLRQRGENSWEAVFSYEDPFTRKTKRVFKTLHADGKRAAKAEFDKLCLQLNSEGVLPNEALTVNDLIEQYIHSKVTTGSVEASTLRSYKSDAKLVVDRIGGLSAQKLSIEQVDSWIADLLKDGYAPVTIRRAHGKLKSAISFAVASGKVAKNVCDHTTLPKAGRKERPVLNREERWTLFNAVVKGLPDRTAIALLLALTLGLRRQEIAGLRFSDLDVDRRTLTINRVVAIGESTPYLKEAKTSSSHRVIPLSDVTFELLKRVKDCADKTLRIREEVGDPYIAGTWKRDSVFYHPTTMSKDYRTFCRALGLPQEVRLHDLRHGWATVMAEAGVDPATLAHMLGHASPALTMSVYCETTAGAKRAAAEKVDECLGISLLGGGAECAKLPENHYSVDELEAMLEEARKRAGM